MPESMIDRAAERVAEVDKSRKEERALQAEHNQKDLEKRKELESVVAPRRAVADRISSILKRVDSNETIILSYDNYKAKHRLWESDPIPLGELAQADSEGRTHAFAAVYRKDRLYKVKRRGILGSMGISMRTTLDDGSFKAGIELMAGTADGEMLEIVDQRAVAVSEGCQQLIRWGDSSRIRTQIDDETRSDRYAAKPSAERLLEWVTEIEEVLAQEPSVTPGTNS